MKDPEHTAVDISIGLLAWNEEDSIAVTLRSLFQQSLFAELRNRGARCEILVVANGCTDQTAQIAAQTLQSLMDTLRLGDAASARVVDVCQRGKANAWNLFVHELSNPSAECLFVMDADIVFSTTTTLWKMFQTLLETPQAVVVVDQPVKDVSLKPRKSLMDYVSLATSSMTQSDSAQLTGQLYGIRARQARLIYLPRDVMVEDGFIKALVCTDGLITESNPQRIVRAADAGHVFEAYTSPASVIRNQKRQVIGQTMLHVLLDKEMKEVMARDRRDVSTLLKERDEIDPTWLRRIVDNHVRKTHYFWQLFPGLLSFRWQRWAKLKPTTRLRYLPAALAGFCVTLLASWLAWRFLRRGFDKYWPDTRSRGLNALQTVTTVAASQDSLATDHQIVSTL
jgi:glycosyltransferase involved in cell wall biosynthesis